ncbi:MAG: bifunctional proline dehydrogenase/L-glutamate gamma-semialdehyde dehydrogenase [Ilumatobacteraceae bacterium]
MDADDERRIEDAISLARRFVDEAAAVDRASGVSARLQQRRLRTLVSNPAAADFTVSLTDEVSRISIPARAARRLAELVRGSDLSAFPLVDRVMLAAGARVAPLAPRLVMPLVQRRLRAEADGVILPASDPEFADHLARRASDGVRCNVNVLGEAIVGDGEARRRLDMVLARIRRPDVDYVSVKISAICPSISVLAFDDTVDRVVDRLRPLYEAAASFDPPKFVNLDMEEYSDLDLTIAVFRRMLDEPEFESLDAGIVLQAYLPDAQRCARELGRWAVERRVRGGGRIKIRIVKGANLAMETVEAELAGWAVAPYLSKAEVDANYKAVLDILAAPEFDDAVRVGVATHNLFDVAWAFGVRRQMDGRPSRLEFEMLEGMAPSQADAVRATTGDLLVYSPVVTRDDFPAAIAYLVRRLDENTSPDNFLAHVFDLADDEELFATEAAKFASAVRERHRVSADAHRHQDRSQALRHTTIDDTFTNAPDTDWTQMANRSWIGRHLATTRADALAVDDHADGVELGGHPSVADVDRAVAISVAARPAWAANRDRAEILNAVADHFEIDRGRVIATMAAEAGKTVEQGDPEVSEAVDFARYYARAGARIEHVDGARAMPRGTVVVAPPWNFPYAIPAGGVLAALAAGNTVILKPAPQTVRTAARIAQSCWNAGVPRDVLQFVTASDDEAGRRLITHPDVGVVILTGAHDTASMFHSWRPDLRLHAETSGKNALVISATADLDHAVADLIASAFGHAGQKCSAASLAILEAPLYDSAAFLERIRDAAATLRPGPADDLTSDVGPLVDPPGEALERALTTLEAGESWLLEPRCLSDDQRSWSPGIKLGVRPGSWFAGRECFGPVLGIMRADDLDHAIEIQNSTDFGLTAGLHALDPYEIDDWLGRVEAGNLYVNRGITGAIVQRQPFGGWKRSVVGPTMKAGGPNYVHTLCRWLDDESVPISEMEPRFRRWWDAVGSLEHDVTGLAAERNGFRYRSLLGGIAVRFGPAAIDRQREIVRLAAHTTGCRLVISEAADEPTDAFVQRLGVLGVDRLRSIGHAVDGAEVGEAVTIAAACHRHDISFDDADPVAAPEIELPRWLREQSVTVTNHRHGRVSRQTASVTNGSSR